MKVYVASNTSRAEEIIYWAEEWNVRLISSWPEMIVEGVPETPANAKVFWQLDVEEVKNADVLVVLCTPDVHLRGALVEVGVALSADVPIVLVGDHDSYGTWRHHPSVHEVPDLASVRPFLDLLARIHG